MTPIVTTQHPSIDRRRFLADDATVRPDAPIVDGFKAPAIVSTTATMPSFRLKARLDPLVTVVSIRTVRSGHTDQSLFPHRSPHHLA